MQKHVFTKLPRSKPAQQAQRVHPSVSARFFIRFVVDKNSLISL
jgi:hypothetical protein